jgi:hypothetical protein
MLGLPAGRQVTIVIDALVASDLTNGDTALGAIFEMSSKARLDPGMGDVPQFGDPVRWRF